MSKTSKTMAGAARREMVWRKVADLAVHPQVAATPELVAEAPEWLAIDSMTEDRGEILTPLFITPEDEVIDGRHRLKSARRHGLVEVPCLVIEEEEEIARIILDALCARRHYTRSARAYLALPLIEEAVAAAAARRAAAGRANLGHSQSTDSVGSLGKNGSGFADLAARLGISTDMMTLARNTARAFKAADQLLEKWLLAHPRDAALWQDAKDEGQSWNTWRAARLLDMGERPSDPSTVELIPESLREVYEAALFEGDMGLGAINKAIGGAMATKGQKRGDLDFEAPAYAITLKNKVISFNDSMWKHWDKLPFERRTEVALKLAETAATWPEEVKRALGQHLAAGKARKSPADPSQPKPERAH